MTELQVLAGESAVPASSAGPPPTWRQRLCPKHPSPQRQFYTIAGTYILFTLVDGSLRLIVLLQANQVGFTGFQVALMFVLYELLGVFTNLGAGVLGARFGLKNTLLLGLALEVASVRCMALLLMGVPCGWAALTFFRAATFDACFVVTQMVLLMPFTSPERWQLLGSQAGQVLYIMFAQAFAGVAKDMVKLSGKSVTKLAAAARQADAAPSLALGSSHALVESSSAGTAESDRGVSTANIAGSPSSDSAPTPVGPTSSAASDKRLFNLVVWVTGFKNEFKGLGFFLGTLLQSQWGFLPALLLLSGLVLLLLPAAVLWLDRDLGRAGKAKAINLRSVFRKPVPFQLLCLARFFLFGSRDLWFDVVLPLFLKNVLAWSALVVGAFLAGWTILYGVIQSASGPLALRPLKCEPASERHLMTWAAALAVWMAMVAGAFTAMSATAFGPGGTYAGAVMLPPELFAPAVSVIVVGLLVYAVVFAVNSAVHSYLAVALADHDKVAMDVGFYYMANAGGRLTGTLIGGVLYSYYVPGESYTLPDADGGDPTDVSADKDASARFVSFTTCLWASAIWSILATAASAAIGRYQRRHYAMREETTN